MADLHIDRINELYRKSQKEGLTEAEKEEQAKLRRNYIDAVKKNLRGQLNQINIQETDGSITNLGEKFGQKKSQKTDAFTAKQHAGYGMPEKKPACCKALI